MLSGVGPCHLPLTLPLTCHLIELSSKHGVKQNDKARPLSLSPPIEEEKKIRAPKHVCFLEIRLVLPNFRVMVKVNLYCGQAFCVDFLFIHCLTSTNLLSLVKSLPLPQPKKKRKKLNPKGEIKRKWKRKNPLQTEKYHKKKKTLLIISEC